MKARWLIGFLLMACLVAPATAQEAVFGFYEGPEGEQNAGTGAVGLTGWALASSGVAKVVVQVDGVDFGQAVYGKFRPDVAAQFPGFPDSQGAGFTYVLNTTEFTNGNHTVSIKVVSNLGTETVINGTENLFITNNTSLLRPFGEITFPQRGASLYGTCNRANPIVYTPVVGWALDLGVEIGDTGLGYVELLLDGVPLIEPNPNDPEGDPVILNTRIGCYLDRAIGGFVNCYGLPRLRIERRFPFALDAPNAGFRFALDIGHHIAVRGIAQGQHVLTIRAGDISNQVENIDEFPVNMFCIEDFPGQGAPGFIEQPREGFQYSGDILVQGWAIDLDGVNRIDVYVDGVFFGNAMYGVDSRPGVAAQYPGFPDVGAPVFRTTIDSTLLSDGVHQIEIFSIDEIGFENLVGERSFFVNNDLVAP
ncbi:MAG: hypothetical protein AAGN46_07555 [Acidobacteriota bacterium]